MSDKYILVGKEVIEEPDAVKWATWLHENSEKRIVGRKEFSNGYVVSTGFLGLDQNFSEGEPLLFETMIFSPTKEHLYQERYSTYDQAERGHEEAVAATTEAIEEGAKAP
jgi:hypothetical protein